jgi:hypothetical protein
VRNTKTDKKLTSVAVLLYITITSNSGKQPFEHVDQVDKKKCLQVTLSINSGGTVLMFATNYEKNMKVD